MRMDMKICLSSTSTFRPAIILSLFRYMHTMQSLECIPGMHNLNFSGIKLQFFTGFSGHLTNLCCILEIFNLLSFTTVEETYKGVSKTWKKTLSIFRVFYNTTNKFIIQLNLLLIVIFFDIASVGLLSRKCFVGNK